MISKNKIKLLCSLKLKKYRQQHHITLLEGLRLIDESINFNANIEGIWMTDESIKNNPNFINKIKSKNITFDTINNEDLKIVSDTNHSQGILAAINIKKYYDSQLSNIVNNNIIILDNISDPGNLGTIFRTCAWYNIKSIILAENTVDPFNLKSLRSGMGAHFYFDDIITSNSKAILEFLDNNQFDILCADLKGKNISELKINNKWALILGSEAHGISEDFKDCPKVTIQQFGQIESLNVSVACGIILENITKND